METLGGSTTVIGGRTLAPTVITVTPNPHPTTVPSTTDPIINPHTVVWTSGTDPTPTASRGCIGCGSPCKFAASFSSLFLILYASVQYIETETFPQLPQVVFSVIQTVHSAPPASSALRVVVVLAAVVRTVMTSGRQRVVQAHTIVTQSCWRA